MLLTRAAPDWGALQSAIVGCASKRDRRRARPPRLARLRVGAQPGWGTSPQSMGVHALRTQRPREPMTCGLACRASNFFLLSASELLSMRCLSSVKTPTLDRSLLLGIGTSRQQTHLRPRTFHLGSMLLMAEALSFQLLRRATNCIASPLP